MRLSFPFLLLTLAWSCDKKPRPAPPPPSDQPPVAIDTPPAPSTDEDERAWVSYAGDGKTTLRQKSVGGQCYSECTTGDGKRVWEGVSPCLAEKFERRFVSVDCERVVVFNPAPNRGRAWSTTEVMRVYAKNRLDYSVSGSTVLPEKYMATSRSWLKGCLGIPGNEPRYAADALSVEYETVDGKSGAVPLVVEKAIDLSAEPKPKVHRRKK